MWGHNTGSWRGAESSWHYGGRESRACHDGSQLGGHLNWQRVTGLPVSGHSAESELLSGLQALHLRGAQQGTARCGGRYLQDLGKENKS